MQLESQTTQMANANTAPAMPLTMLRAGETGRVVEILAPGHGIIRRLMSMGIMAGTELTVLNGQGGGAVIVRVGEGRFVLGRGIAHRVMVQAGDQ